MKYEYEVCNNLYTKRSNRYLKIQINFNKFHITIKEKFQNFSSNSNFFHPATTSFLTF